MRNVLEMARFELAAALRTKRAIALVAIYLVTSLFGMSGAITALGKMEAQLANILQVEAVDGKSGVVSAALAETYDAIGKCADESRRDEVSKLNLADFIDPSVAEPFVAVQDKLESMK